MKKILLVFIFFSVNFLLFSQRVWDIGQMEALIEQHKTQYAGLKNIKEEEAQLLIINTQIKTKLEEVKKIQETSYKALKDIELIIKNAKDIIYITDLIADIGKYQNQMLVYAKNDPRLVLIAAQTELELIKKTKKLMEYLIVATTGTDLNLMNNKQRTELIKYIVKELRVMRGLAYSVCRQMKSAMKYGVIKALKNVKWKEFVYPGKKESSNQRVKEILENFNTGRKK